MLDRIITDEVESAGGQRANDQQQLAALQARKAAAIAAEDFELCVTLREEISALTQVKRVIHVRLVSYFIQGPHG